MIIQILDKAKKKKIIEQIEQFGIKKIPHLLIRTGNERIRAFSGNLSTEEIMDLWRILPFEGIGLYIGKEIEDKSGTRNIRLSVDGVQAYKDQINKKILTLKREQEDDWFKGKEIELDEAQIKEIANEKGIFVIRSYDDKDLLGTGKIGEKNVLFGYLPKERRRKVMVL
jgi:NOL1/NOP2/fmu family ribosome biogenesis protein